MANLSNHWVQYAWAKVGPNKYSSMFNELDVGPQNQFSNDWVQTCFG